MTTTPPRPLTLADVRPNTIYTLRQMAALVNRCTRTLKNHKVKTLPRHGTTGQIDVLGSTILDYVGLTEADLVRPTETARQVTKRSKAVLDAAVLSLKPQVPSAQTIYFVA